MNGAPHPHPMPSERPTKGWHLTTRGGSADRYVVRASEGGWETICTLFCGPQNRRGLEAQRAGLIMASAPEMLEALQAVEAARITDLPKDWTRATKLTDAAIAKATGAAS